ncbi:MAG: hypothetical protein O2923_10815 [Verrucomicrobia bacterium]|nr:hypothetical protein [Verrucomicrobiota bacterium]MDA1257854.1 hypothetical protein [Chloroflexota bacterium]
MYRYPWPASGISSQEMALLYQARKASNPRVSITELIRRAVIGAYGQESRAQDNPQAGEDSRRIPEAA